jgi:serine/threonine protein kinase
MFAGAGERVWRSLLERMLSLEEHNHVLGLREVVEDDEAYYLIMERCSGGELFDFLQNETDVPERECKRIMREILQAVDHIHTKGLIHRDIKPENIMFHDTTGAGVREKSPDMKSPGNKKTIKLIDFDTCQEYEPGSPSAKHVVGTMGYIAPEALKGEYSPASDLWSVGVILYILMTGDMPFPAELFAEEVHDNKVGSKSMDSLHDKLRGATIDFDCDPWPAFPQARDLCRSLLAFNPGDRSPSARDALNHPWLRSGK